MNPERASSERPIRPSRWVEARLAWLERGEHFEDAYALRMEMAEWLLEACEEPPFCRLHRPGDGTPHGDSLVSDPG